MLLLLGGGIFLLSSKSKNPPKSNSQTVSQPSSQISPSPAATTANKSIKDLLMMGVSQKCTFTKNDTETSSTITIYMDNGHVRGDIETVASGKTVDSHMIIQGTETYIWMEGQNSGFKMAFNSNTPTSKPVQGQNNSVNPDEKVDYVCSPWSADQTIFSLPANIQFSDFSKMVVPTVGTTNKCDACNYLTGDAKTQCLSAMGCN